jgi:hypothetical protein
MTGGGFWDDQERAREVVQRVKSLKAWVEPFDKLGGVCGAPSNSMSC